jgi:hypothetical protein
VFQIPSRQLRDGSQLVDGFRRLSSCAADQLNTDERQLSGSEPPGHEPLLRRIDGGSRAAIGQEQPFATVCLPVAFGT